MASSLCGALRSETGAPCRELGEVFSLISWVLGWRREKHSGRPWMLRRQPGAPEQSSLWVRRPSPYWSRATPRSLIQMPGGGQRPGGGGFTWPLSDSHGRRWLSPAMPLAVRLPWEMGRFPPWTRTYPSSTGRSPRQAITSTANRHRGSEMPHEQPDQPGILQRSGRSLFCSSSTLACKRRQVIRWQPSLNAPSCSTLNRRNCMAIDDNGWLDTHRRSACRSKLFSPERKPRSADGA